MSLTPTVTTQTLPARRKKPKAITVLKKEGGAPARYDHDHRFNGFFFTPSLSFIRNVDNKQIYHWKSCFYLQLMTNTSVSTYEALSGWGSGKVVLDIIFKQSDNNFQYHREVIYSIEQNILKENVFFFMLKFLHWSMVFLVALLMSFGPFLWIFFLLLNAHWSLKLMLCNPNFINLDILTV